ncbi:MAG: phosphodiester glycosidase family protein [Myxococcota bacterium]
MLPTTPRSRWLIGLAAFGMASVIATWLAIRHVPWFGPLVADNLRTLLGSENVTTLEEAVASVEDRVHSAVSDGRARGLSEATPTELLTSDATPAAVLPAVTRPRDVGALHASTQSAEDGKWQPVRVRGSEASVLHRTIVHPDAERAYAELFVFALDLSQVKVQAVAGSIEPRNPDASTNVARSGAVSRLGIVPNDDRPRLIAAFNGGFKAEHGQFGMMVDGQEILAPKQRSCTFAARNDGSLTIATWTALVGNAPDLSWWRQTPGCMIEKGVLHPGLRSADSTNWGATLEGKTVIRRSAVGLSEDGKTLFVGISNSTTARALALGMQHAGARDVAQLDVNFSFPRFLLYRDTDAGALNAIGAVRGLLYEKDEYLGRASTRDFFYVTLR